MEAVNGLMTYCRVTGKVCYTSKIKALLALVKIEEVGPRTEGGPIPKRTYLCEFCNRFHLTSQEERPKKTGDPLCVTRNKLLALLRKRRKALTSLRKRHL